MTTVQKAAMVFGWIFIIVAALGFFTSGLSMEADLSRAARIFGLFPVNLLHNLVHLAFGIWGVAAARKFSSARTYCRAAGVIYLGLGFLGILLPTFFGLIPIGEHDIWLHFLLGIGLAFFGFREPERETPMAA